MKFEIMTPLGFSVRTSEDHWQRIVLKHPDIADAIKEGEVLWLR
jgi:hypothetical protein